MGNKYMILIEDDYSYSVRPLGPLTTATDQLIVPQYPGVYVQDTNTGNVITLFQEEPYDPPPHLQAFRKHRKESEAEAQKRIRTDWLILCAPILTVLLIYFTPNRYMHTPIGEYVAYLYILPLGLPLLYFPTEYVQVPAQKAATYERLRKQLKDEAIEKYFKGRRPGRVG